MRNARSPQRRRFLALRQAAIAAMAGRKWYDGPVGLALTYWAPDPPGVFDRQYLGGVMDTLGGSHGPTFIYLPIVYLDDCQVSGISARPLSGPTVRYEIEVEFMPSE
jgi:hypothetical protein